jgi:hypothetical protein
LTHKYAGAKKKPGKKVRDDNYYKIKLYTISSHKFCFKKDNLGSERAATYILQHQTQTIRQKSDEK